MPHPGCRLGTSTATRVEPCQNSREAGKLRFGSPIVTVLSDEEVKLRTTAEAALALVIVLVLGAGFWFFGGGELGGDGSTETTTPIVVDPEAAGRGLQLANNSGCLACHTVDGTPGTGPTWSGVAGATVQLESGESEIADTAYLFNSIVDPGSHIVAGFADVMPPDYADQLTEAEINDLVSYIQSLAG